MLPDVERAIEEIQRAFPGNTVEVVEDAQGGAWVLVDDLELGPAFFPDRSWIGFPISHMYPRADVYPHFVRPDLRRADGAGLTSPLNANQTLPGFSRPAVMVSRRSTRWNPSLDTALLKLLRVQQWFAEQDLNSQAAA